MCVGMRVGHRNDDSDTHVPAARTSKMRLYRESEVGIFAHFYTAVRSIVSIR